MHLKFFAIPALDSATAEAELNRFLSSNRILTVDRELVTERHGTYWAVAVEFLDKEAATTARGGSKKPKIDYRELLPPEDFEVYAELRTLRLEVANDENVPPYMVFTNAQLAEMVQGRIRTFAEMAKIAGVGPARLKSHGARFLDRLKEIQKAVDSKEKELPGEVP